MPGELIMSVVQSQTTRSCNFHNHDRSDSLRRREVICLILEIYSNLNRAETAENLGRLSQNSIALFNLSIEKSLQFHNIKFRSLRNASCILELKNTRDPTLYISIESRLNVVADAHSAVGIEKSHKSMISLSSLSACRVSELFL